MRVLLHTGKGGVGKTSLSLATALAAAEHGHRVFALSTDAAHSLGDALGRRVGARPIAVAEGVVAQEVAVVEELARSWEPLQGFLHRLLRDEADPLVAEELLAFPGLEELIALRAIREVAETGDFDVCVVDCAPTGSTLRMLRFPEVLRIFMEDFFDLERRGARLLRPVLQHLRAGALLPEEEIFDAFERLYNEVDDVRRILLDEERTRARLVVNPARVVVEEARRSFAYLSLYGVATDAVLVNRLLPGEAAGGFFSRWAERERSQLAAIEASFPVPRFHAPLYASEPRGLAALRRMARDLYGERDPAELFCRGRPIRLARHMGRTRLEVDLPGASKEEVSLQARGGELVVRVRDVTRLIALPGSVSSRRLQRHFLRDGVLCVDFE